MTWRILLPPLCARIGLDGEAAPTYDLDAVKQILGSVRALAITTSALRDATALGFDRHGVAATIRGLEQRMFVKSMTTYADHRVRQDV